MHIALILLTDKKSEPALLFSPLEEGQKIYPKPLAKGLLVNQLSQIRAKCKGPRPLGRAGGFPQLKSTAIMPPKKMASKVPAPPMEATGAPNLGISRNFSKSAPIKIPRVQAI